MWWTWHHFRTDDGPYMLGPSPPRLEDGTPDHELAELHQLDAAFLNRSDLVRGAERKPAQTDGRGIDEGREHKAASRVRSGQGQEPDSDSVP
jgi:hypothetical protein